jgi:hypothetical protein
MGELAGCSVRSVMRIERVAEEALGPTFGEFRERLRDEVRSARERGFAGLKTIAAYRTGLDLAAPDPAAAESAFARSAPRLESKPLLELALWDALDISSPSSSTFRRRRSSCCTATRTCARPAGSPMSTRTCSSTSP